METLEIDAVVVVVVLIVLFIGGYLSYLGLKSFVQWSFKTKKQQ